MYGGVQSVIQQVNQFDESSAVNTAYLGKVNMKKEDAFKAQEQFILTDHSSRNIIRWHKMQYTTR